MVIIFSSPPFYTNHVQLPIGTDPVPPEISNNPKFWPYFKDAVGAVDGTHFPCAPPSYRRPFYRDCKGSVTQNCLFACSFALKCIYALTGWNGTATDALLWQDVLKRVFLFLKVNIYLDMQDFQPAQSFLHHIKVFNITWKSGGMHI